MWNVDSEDTTHTTSGNFTALNEEAYNKAMTGKTSATSSFISLQHDIINSTVHQWTQIVIDKIRAANYTFVTVGNCVGHSSQASWYRQGALLVPSGTNSTANGTGVIDNNVGSKNSGSHTEPLLGLMTVLLVLVYSVH